MQRDMDLVRNILFTLEAKEHTGATIGLQIEGYTGENIAYHCKMMKENGLIDFYSEQRTGNGQLYCFTVGDLSWDGQDFLDKIRQDTVWNKTKAVIHDKGLPMVIDVVKDVSSAVIQSMVQGAVKGLTGQT